MVQFSKGFGFIQPEGGGNDVFVHISAVEQAGLSQLNENQKVSFETETGRNGKGGGRELEGRLAESAVIRIPALASGAAC